MSKEILTARDSAHIVVEEDLMCPVAVALPKGEAVLFTMGWDSNQKPNEDVVGVIPVGDSSALLVVADGMGGTRNGAQAASLAVHELAKHALANEAESTLRTAILDAIEIANRRIIAEVPDGGTTLALVELSEHCARPFHIGDSTVLVTGQRGRIQLNTVAHSPVGFAVEAGFLDVDDALHHNQRHIISNALGFEEMRIELGASLKLARFDTVLIASDGLTDNVFMDEIVAAIRCGPLDRAVMRLVHLARERMAIQNGEAPRKPDDLSIVAYRRNC